MMYMTKEDRLLPLKSFRNTRELGGYETQEGSFTKTHCFIRAATPAFLIEEDKEYLYNYGVRVVIDLRGKEEIEKAPNQLKGYKDIKYYHIDIFNEAGNTLTPQDLQFKDMGDLYCLMLKHLYKGIKDVFEIFLNHMDTTVLFHCSAGKDRTGVISALLLDLAGCHPYDIVKDYSESYENNKEIYDELLKMIEPGKEYFLSSDPLYMLKMMDYLNENYGSARSYLLSLGIAEQDLEDLIEHFTI